MRISRLMQMESYILEQSTATIEELCDKFQVSKNTVRRDLDVLVSKGVVRKIYGGAAANHAKDTVPFEERNVKNISAKERIGKKAAEFIGDGDSVFFDSGTTLTALYYVMPEKRNLTVFTNNLEIVTRGALDQKYRIIVAGGELARKTYSMVGSDVARALSCYNIEKAFMSATGVSLESGASNSSRGEFEAKKAAIRRARYRYLLVDSSKFDTNSLMTFAELSEFDVIITDAMPEPKYVEYCEKAGIDLIVAP